MPSLKPRHLNFFLFAFINSHLQTRHQRCLPMGQHIIGWDIDWLHSRINSFSEHEHVHDNFISHRYGIGWPHDPGHYRHHSTNPAVLSSSHTNTAHDHYGFYPGLSTTSRARRYWHALSHFLQPCYERHFYGVFSCFLFHVMCHFGLNMGDTHGFVGKCFLSGLEGWG